MTTQKKKAVEAVSAAKVVNGVKTTVGSIGTTVLPPSGATSPVVIGPVAIGSATAGSLTSAQTEIGSTKLPVGFLAALQALLQGIEKMLPDGASLTAVNGTYAKADMVTQIQSCITLYSDVATQENAAHAARLTLAAAIPAARQYYAELKGVLTGFYHAGNPSLTEFGFKPKKARAPQTGEKMVAAAVRNTETRDLRGTLGKKAKLAIKYTGSVTPAAASSTDSGAASAAAGAAPVVGSAEPVVALPAKPVGQ